MTNEEINLLEQELEGVSPHEWKLLCGRPGGVTKLQGGREMKNFERWDIYSGEDLSTIQELQVKLREKKVFQVTHFHSESPALYDWHQNSEKDMRFLVKAKIIAKELIETHRELQKLKGEQNGK